MLTNHYPSAPRDDQPTAVLEQARAAKSMLISLSGLRGIGKTIWVRRLADDAGRFRVVSVSADSFEASFPFALADKVVRAAGHPNGVFEEGTTPDLASVIRSLLTTLSRNTSTARRLLLIIDNAHWIDEASLQALRFVLGRIAFSGACAVFSGLSPHTDDIATGIVHAEPGAWSDVRTVHLEPLDVAGVRAYISQVHGIEVSLRLAERIRELSGGLPLLIDAVVAAMEPPPGAARAHWDEDVRLPLRPESPITRQGYDTRPEVTCAVEIVSMLRDAVSAREVEQIATLLGDVVDVEAAIAEGLLIRAAPGTVRPFHDLFATDLRERLQPERKSAILAAAAESVSNPHRALLCRLDAATELDPELLLRVREAAESARATGNAERAIGYLRRAADLADPALRGELLVEACVLAGAAFVSPVVLDLLPELEALPRNPVRDLALLQTRQITGDIEWALAFVGELLATETDHPDAAVLRMHVTMMAVMIQLTTDDYAPVLDLLDAAREIARGVQAGATGVHDERLAPLPSAEEILLRATGLAVVASARTAETPRMLAEVESLSRLIHTAGASPALSDALTCRGGVLAGAGAIEAATADLERSLALAADGTVGWSLGHARVLLAYCWWLKGRVADARAMLEDAVVAALDSIDVASRPLVYLLRAVLAAEAGDEDSYAENQRIAREVTVTDYDTFGAELELLAVVQRARARNRPDEVLEALSPDALGGRWLAGAGIFTYRVEALAALGRAEEADRSLSELHERAGRDWSPIYGSLNWLEGRVAEAYGLHDRALRAYRLAAREGAPVPRAQALHDAGRLHILLGETAAGTRLLRQAAELFSDLGALPALRRTLALIEDVDPATIAGIEALSTREREVAQLAALGRTNAEIAESLYLATPTVAFHMRKVLAKLGLSSRRELGAVLSQTSPG
ncbi:LuxR C-terminal-related transcriptional regulator [Plantibacter sp. Mn2098]|uniref:helix-turn-helix transcriptional regulator n=1 Tax=Plantibacter sp. Mn2098 TaxID=3395266 RepID=UPI003BCB8FA6